MPILRAVAIGMLVMLAGTIPRNIFYALNVRYWPQAPWAALITALYIVAFWRWLGGAGPPAETAQARRAGLRANALPLRLWVWSLAAGSLGVLALVLGLRLLNRLVVLPEQALPDLSKVPAFTIIALLLVAAPVAGVVEEAAFRGYMQGPLERRFGFALTTLITGTMFAVAHLDFTPALWPYYVAVSAIYGATAYLTNSILPAVALHTAGNLYSNFDIWLHGRAEWQAPAGARLAGLDSSFWLLLAGFAATTALAALAYSRLALLRSRG